MRKKTKMFHKQRGTYFTVHTLSLLKEIMQNPGTSILKIPINYFGKLLADVADRCIELQDPILNKLMCDLTLYEQADPYSKDYDKEMIEKVYNRYNEFYEQQNKIKCKK